MSPRFRSISFKYLLVQCERIARMGLVCGLACQGTAFVYAQAPGARAGANGAHYTQSDFVLPFHVKPGGRCPQQLDLLLSRDGGRSWQIHQTAAPAEGCFRFLQANEGEYWFKVQARDASGSSLSQSTVHLFVDRTQPEASLECDWTGDGQLDLTCRLSDQNLNLESLRLQLRTDNRLEPVVIPLQPGQVQGTQVIARSTHVLPDCKSFELRLSVADRSGNVRVVSERFFHPTLANADDALLPSSDAVIPPAPPKPPTELEIAQSEKPAVELGTPGPLVPAQLVSAGRGQSILRKQEPHHEPHHETPGEPAPLEITPPPRPNADSTGLSLDSSRPTPAIQSSSRRIGLKYERDPAVRSEQLQVELWVTTDHGQTWEFWGVDRDALSPASVEVDDDGEYGFCIVCLHSPMDVQFRPTPGTPPDLLVNVKQPLTAKRLVPAARQ